MLFLIMVFSFLEITAILLGIATGRAITDHFIKQNRKNELLSVVEDPLSVDSESGIEHYKHIACNAAFICEILKGEGKE